MNDPELSTTLLLVLTALFAGWIDAVVGGGGLVQLPALVIAFPQAAPVHLLAVNKLSSICGTTTSAVTYLRRIRPDPRTALLLAVTAFCGSVLGALLAARIPKEAFSPIILGVLIGVGIYTLARPDLGSQTSLRFTGRRHHGAAMGIGAAAGLYDGALGPGTGSFLVFALVGWCGYAFLEATAKAKVANMMTNLAAVIVFAAHGAVHWRLGLLMGMANVVGGYLGTRTAVSRGNGFVRTLFVLVVGAFIIRIGWDVVAMLW